MLALFQPVVSLPSEIKLAIAMVVTFGVAFLLNQLTLIAPWLKDFLGQYKDKAVALITAALITFIETQLNLFPQYEAVTNAVLALLVVIIGLVGLPVVAFTFLRRRGFKRFA